MSLQQIEREAWRLMREHGLVDHGWVFKWDHAVRTLGKCYHGRRQITLSKKVFSIPENVPLARNTMLHEIAHALVGPSHGHDHVWKRQARAIGCTGDRCTELATKPMMKYGGSCGCGDGVHQMSRLSKRFDGSIAVYSCRKCRKQIIWKVNR